MLGWKVLDGAYDIKINLPQLSEEEEYFINKVIEILRKRNIEDVNEEILLAIEEAAAEENVILDDEQVEYIFHIIKKTHFGLGFLEELLQRDDIEEIAIIGINKPVYAYVSKEGWKTVNVSITSSDYLINLINKISLKSGRRITLKQPRLNANLPGLRLHATIKPISEGEITIRKFRSSPITIKEMEGVYPLEVIAWLSLIMQSDSSLVIGGNTGSGKTSFLNALFTFVPKNERIVIIEETPEISIAHKHQVRLVENLELGVTLKELVYDTLRMRSDRTIVGEVRKPEEVQALMDVVLSGQARGTYATFHANNLQEFISRLKSYGVLEEDINAIDFLAVQRRLLTQTSEGFKEIRKGIGIYHVPTRTPLYEYTRKGPVINHEGFKDIVSEKLWMEENEVEKLFQERKEVIKRLEGDFEEQFHQYQIECFGI